MEIVFYNPDEDDDDVGDQAWSLVPGSGIRILSDKDLKAVAVDGEDVVGALFDSVVGNQYSFDVVVAPPHRGKGAGSALIDAALEEYESIRAAGVELVLDVVNESMISALERRGLSVLDKEGNHAIMGYGSSKTAATRLSLDPTPELTPGVGFFLEGDGHWDVQEIPDWVFDVAEFSGYLTIKGYSCAVFETPEGEQWGQKISGTPAPKGDEAARDVFSSFHGMASRVAAMKTSRTQLDSGLLESARSMAEEMGTAEEALHRAVQYGRRLSIEPSFEWIVNQLESTLQEFREFRKGAGESVEYLTDD